MSAKIEFFPVDNGDMTLITLESGRKILIDVHIRSSENIEDPCPDVLKPLRDRLNRDENNRLYVDAFILSHPDKDHTYGLTEFFHFGSPETWNEDLDKIIINEMWSSPIIFRRKGKQKQKDNLTLCDDALNWWNEARRRVAEFKNGNGGREGNRILILGKDEYGKSDGLEQICVELGTTFNSICNNPDSTFTADLIGPIPKQDDEEIEDALAKNRSSIIIRFHIASQGNSDACLFLSAGDAEVFVWERLWEMHKNTPDILNYDVLQVPHHCSIHSLSYDSWSEKGESLQISEGARKALSQANAGATIIASCKPILDDDCDPPCIRASREYEDVAKSVNGKFVCTMTHPGSVESKIFTINIGGNGGDSTSSGYSGPIAPINTRLDPPSREFEKSGGGRYA